MTTVAVIIPCYNEEQTIAKVVRDFSAVLPEAVIYVFDNNSTDLTAQKAREAGAKVVHSPRQGKGNVVKHMFREVDADLYLIVDGDDTYPAATAPLLIETLLSTGADVVVGMRLAAYREKSFRAFHRFGNRLVARLISTLFSANITDVMSGYRVFTRSFVKSVPLLSGGFEIETEMTLQALAKQFAIREVPVEYGERPEGSYSKLNTYRDGYRVLKSIFLIFKDYKPLVFFGGLGGVLTLLSVLCGVPPVLDYIKEGYVFHVPLAILAVGTGILAGLSIGIGLILDTISKYHAENFELLRRIVNYRHYSRSTG